MFDKHFGCLTKHCVFFPYQSKLGWKFGFQGQEADFRVEDWCEQISCSQKVSQTLLYKWNRASVDYVIGCCNVQILQVCAYPMCNFTLKSDSLMHDQWNCL